MQIILGVIPNVSYPLVWTEGGEAHVQEPAVPESPERSSAAGHCEASVAAVDDVVIVVDIDVAVAAAAVSAAVMMVVMAVATAA